MGTYIVRRLLHGLLVLFGVSIVVFGLVHLGGDPVAMLLPLDAPPEQIEAFRHTMGFDRPLPVQYGLFISRAVRGDFGYSYHYRRDAMLVVLERMPYTLKLAGAALGVTLVIAIPAGILSALKRDSILDGAVLQTHHPVGSGRAHDGAVCFRADGHQAKVGRNGHP